MLNTKPTIVEALLSMPDGEDADFARVEYISDKRCAVEQMQRLMASAPCIEQLDLKTLIEDGRTGDEILDAMIAQMNKMTTSAEEPIDDTLAEVDAFNQRIKSMDRKANGKAT